MIKDLFRIRYRVVTDNYKGFEIQYRFWYIPFWAQADLNGKGANTFSSPEEAKEEINNLKSRECLGNVVHKE